MSAISTQLAHGIKATTTTAGTGSVTLTALTGFMLPLARFSVGSLMSYSIQDGNNREWGIGTVQAGNVLDRTTITGTLVAGTYTVGGTAMALSGGQCFVDCVEHEGSDLNGIFKFVLLANYSGDKTCAAAGASLREAVPSEAVAARITNSSAHGVYIAMGASTVEASSTNGTLVAAGATATLPIANTITHLAYASANSAQTPTFNLAYGN